MKICAHRKACDDDAREEYQTDENSPHEALWRASRQLAFSRLVFFLFSLLSLSFLPLVLPSLGVFSLAISFRYFFLLLGFRRALCCLGLFCVVLISVMTFFFKAARQQWNLNLS
jgi:hypothetical protein